MLLRGLSRKRAKSELMLTKAFPEKWVSGLKVPQKCVESTPRGEKTPLFSVPTGRRTPERRENVVNW
jgi:hypothetical protein